MLEKVRTLASQFDVLHFHVDVLHYPFLHSFVDRTVTTLHGRLDLAELRPLYSTYRHAPLVSISNTQRAPMPPVNWVGNVYHGLPPDLLPFTAKPREGYLAFLGRIAPEKRPTAQSRLPHGPAQNLRWRRRSRPRIGDQLEPDLLTFTQIVHSGTFNRADMNENVLATVIRLNEPVAFRRIVPLHCAYAMRSLSDVSTTTRFRDAKSSSSFDLGGRPRHERLRSRKAKVVQPNFEALTWRCDTALSRGMHEMALWPTASDRV